VIFIAGNLPYVSEIAPLLIVIRLSDFVMPTRPRSPSMLVGRSIIFAVNRLQQGADRAPGAWRLIRMNQQQLSLSSAQTIFGPSQFVRIVIIVVAVAF
jgi:hypothetical protein